MRGRIWKETRFISKLKWINIAKIYTPEEKLTQLYKKSKQVLQANINLLRI